MYAMKRAAVNVAFLIFLAPSLLNFASAASLGSPAEKVVTLLTELKQRLESDNTAEQASFDKYACWCEETTSRKAASIESARAEITQLGQQILAQKALVAEKTVEIKQTMADIKQNEEAQQEATAIRQKENAAHAAEVVELNEAVNALERAIHVLRDATQFSAATGAAGALLQKGSGAATSMVKKVSAALTEVQVVLAAMPDDVLAKRDDRHDRAVASKLQFLSQHTESLVKSSDKSRYVPQSMTVQGILQDLYDTFVKDLEGQHADEAAKSTAYENVMATKHQELVLLQEKVRKAEKVKVEAETMLSEALQTYTDTEEQLKDDVAFFDATKSACTSKTQDWATRKSLRAEQLSGLSEALNILTTDEAKELFGKAIKPGVGMFLQVALAEREVRFARPAQQAIQALRRQAAKTGSLRLAAMAAELQLTSGGHFDEVIASIDIMTGVLKQEATTDLTERDNCVKQLHDIVSKTQDLTWKVKVNDADITKLDEAIQKLEALEVKTGEDIQTVQQQISDLTSNRTQDNSDFKAAKSDDIKAVELLTQAKDALAKYFEDHNIDMGPTESGRAAAFIQLQNDTASNRSDILYNADHAPDMDFAHKGKGKHETKGIIALLETIIEDLNTEVSNAVKAEGSAQLEYEAQKKAAEDLEATLGHKLANLKSDIALRKNDKTNEEEARQTNQGDLDAQNTEKTNIEPRCTQIADRFADRQAKREAEMQGLRQAREFLAGYQVSQGDGSDAPGATLTLAQAKHPQLARLRGPVPVSGQPVRRHA